MSPDPERGLGPDRVFGIPRLFPMLATPGGEPFSDEAWSFEVKWDGYRSLAYLTRGQCYLDSRNQKPLLPRFPGLSGMWRGLNAQSALIDGEIVAFRDGRVDFSHLRTEPQDVVFVAFDLLYVDGKLLLDEPLSERQALLEGVYSWGKDVFRSETVSGQGEALFEWVRERGLEGMMAKRKDSFYTPGKRSKDWIKVKNVQEGRFWVVGYMPGAGRTVGSLVVAREKDGRLDIVGRVSSGLNSRYEKFFLENLTPIDAAAVDTGHVDAGSDLVAPRVEAVRKPVFGDLTRAEIKTIRWVRPFYGVEVQYTEITPDGRLRHPVFREVCE
ncbi:MAG TPA: hypothetical protein GXX23_11155 [Firmicutes bacterium]|nr:hypothetical protein [Candidatus Fermentithermobacillaceae bacterium]